jgi:hypothetical protein
VLERVDTREDAHECDRVRADEDVGVEARMLHAHGRLAAVENHPDRHRAVARVAELDDDPPVGEAVGVDAAVHPPGETDGVDVGRLRLVEHPARGPLADGGEDRLEVASRGGQLVFVPAPAPSRHTDEDALAFEVTQPLHEERT